MANTLDLGPQGSLLCQPQLFFFSGCLRAVYYPDDAQRGLILACAGPHTYYDSTVALPGIPYWMGADYGTWQLLVFAGTANAEQWCGNLLGIGQAADVLYPGLIQNYFRMTANTVYANVQAVMGATSALNKVVCIGHSLGGAVANLVAWRLNVDKPGSCQWVFTEGCPRIGNLEWAVSPSYPILSFKNSGDIVPLVPPERGNEASWLLDKLLWGPCQNYYAVGDLWGLTPSGQPFPVRLNALVQPDAGLTSQLMGQGFNPRALSHATGQYAQRISYWMGGADGMYPGSPLGIDIQDVYGWQASFGAVDGFAWQPQWNGGWVGP